jgi:hypothetical protein
VAKVIGVDQGRAAIFTLCFGYYHVVLGLINFEQYDRPTPAVAGLLLYVAVLLLVTRFTREPRLPTAMTAVALFAAVAIPVSQLYAIGESANYEPHTRYFVAVATVMAILVWRHRTAVAWAGMITMVVSVYVWGGAEIIANSGVLSSFALVAGSQAVAMALKKAEKSADEFLQWRVAVNLDGETVSIQRAEPLIQLKKALDSSLPLLHLIQQKEGKITPSDSKKLLLAEAGIRDQIRAKGFQDAVLIAAVLSARKRGLEVQLSDDGGIDLLEAEKKESLFRELSQTLSGVTAGKVVIRSVAGESWTVSLFASDSSGTSEDLFLRL